MSKDENIDINQMLLKAIKLGVKIAIETAARTKTSLAVSENGKVKLIKPKFKYIRVPIKPAKKKQKSGRSVN